MPPFSLCTFFSNFNVLRIIILFIFPNLYTYPHSTFPPVFVPIEKIIHWQKITDPCDSSKHMHTWQGSLDRPCPPSPLTISLSFLSLPPFSGVVGDRDPCLLITSLPTNSPKSNPCPPCMSMISQNAFNLLYPLFASINFPPFLPGH